MLALSEPDRARAQQTPIPLADEANQQMTRTVDFDLHGFAGVRVIDATRNEITAVQRQLGQIEGSLAGEPDITVRFVDELPVLSRLHYLELGSAAYSDDAFFLFCGGHSTHARVKIPFQDIGSQCEIVCPRGLTGVPLLIDIIGVIALSKGFIPIRAAAFNYGGVGALATGWAKGGKTEVLLGFMERGAQYVAHEWVYLSRDGERMFGIPRAMRLWKWQLDHLPSRELPVAGRNRMKLRLLSALQSLATSISGSGRTGRGSAARLIGRAAALVQKQLYVDVSPGSLFGDSSLALTGAFEKLFLVVSHESREIVVEPIDPSNVARRLWFSLQAERDDFLAAYQQFRFAFPDAPSTWIEQAPELQKQYLLDAFAHKEAYLVSHPHPVAIGDLTDAILPAFAS